MRFANQDTLAQYDNCGGITAIKIGDMIDKFLIADNLRELL